MTTSTSLGTAVANLLAGTVDPTSVHSYLQEYSAPAPKYISVNSVSYKSESNKSYLENIRNDSRIASILEIGETTPYISPYERVNQTIDDYLSLDQGWDGYDGVPPALIMVETAKSFLSMLKQEGLSMPKSMLSSHGDIGFYWKGQESYIEINIEPIDRYSIYIEEGKKFIGEDELAIAGELPEALRIAVKKIS